MEVAKADLPTRPCGTVQTLNDYVQFADLCHSNAQPPLTKGHACFNIAGDARPWTEQNDGPALQSVTILTAYDQLDPGIQKRAVDLVNANVAYLLGVYRDPTTNLWEEHSGYSFFARSAQLRCFQEIQASTIAGIDKPAGLQPAIDWLTLALAGHWDGTKYVSLMADPGDEVPPSPHDPVVSGYDPNIDIVQSAVYGAVPVTDSKLLATAAQLRSQWEQGAGFSSHHFITDASMNYFGSLLLDVPSPGAFIAQSSYSSIGYIAPAATGVCLAKRPGQRVMVFSGGGGFQMTA